MKLAERPLLVALTGSIASGKSLVSEWFRKRKYQVISSDKIGHEVLQDSQVKEILRDRYGNRIINAGIIDRKQLGSIIFADPREKDFLNNLTHPLILERLQKIIDTSLEEIIIFEIPLLFENNLETCFDLIITVSASVELRRGRIIERDLLSSTEAELRIGSQMEDELKVQNADISIENNSSIEDLYRQLEKVDSIIKRSNRKTVKLLKGLQK